MREFLIRFSGVLFIIIVTAVLVLVYYLWGESLGWIEPSDKFRVFCTILFVPFILSLIFISRRSLIALASKLRFFRQLDSVEDAHSGKDVSFKQKSIYKEKVIELKQAMRSSYGLFWFRKVRVLLITGTAAEVEQLTPGLTGQLWQEDRGTLLLWGGDLNTPADNAWLTALRKLRRRPADGLVWVTSAFDQVSFIRL